MANTPNLSIAQRLAIEKQLLREEKFLVLALKTAREERHALQREEMDLHCLLKEVLNKGKQNNSDGKEQEENKPSKPSESLTFEEPMEEAASSNVLCFDNIFNNEVELNLTVPTHNLYDQMPEETEEFEEIDGDDNFEIEMSMFMNDVYQDSYKH